MNDRQRAFALYKQRVKEHGKPFFPNGTYHDVITGVVVMAIIVLLSVVWYSQAACGELFDVTCETVRTVEEQEEGKKLLLGPLYEEKADPGTTEYQPRPEWYFFFLFELLIVFSNPNLLLLGTLVVPTICLVLLLAWPFLDRKKERRPSRRPLAMTGMAATAVVLLALTWAGSKHGQETSGVEGLSEAQVAMPGYALLFEDSRATCGSCHAIDGSGWAGNVGPDLTNIGATKQGDEDGFAAQVAWQVAWLTDPSAVNPAQAGMPSLEGIGYTADEIGQIACFLETLGAPENAEEACPAGGAGTAAKGEGGEAGGTMEAGKAPEGDAEDSAAA